MRHKLLVTFLILLVGFVALALYRHWLFVGVHSTQEGQAQLTVTFDHGKFGEDFASFTGQSQASSQTPVGAMQIHAKILNVDSGRQTIQLQADQGVVTVDVSSSTRIHVGEREAAFADLHTGMTVSVTYVTSGGRNSAQTITAETL